MQDKIAQSERLAMQVSINSIIVNLILSVGKLAAGILANSAAMISDAGATETSNITVLIPRSLSLQDTISAIFSVLPYMEAYGIRTQVSSGT